MKQDTVASLFKYLVYTYSIQLSWMTGWSFLSSWTLSDHPSTPTLHSLVTFISADRSGWNVLGLLSASLRINHLAPAQLSVTVRHDLQLPFKPTADLKEQGTNEATTTRKKKSKVTHILLNLAAKTEPFQAKFTSQSKPVREKLHCVMLLFLHSAADFRTNDTQEPSKNRHDDVVDKPGN